MSIRTFTLINLIFFSLHFAYAQPSITPAPGFRWVLVGTGTYDSGEISTEPGVPDDTSYGIGGDTDPADCSSFCSNNCDGETNIQDRQFGSTPGFSASSCEQRAITLTQWTNSNPESGVANGATSGTVHLPTSAQVNIIQSPNAGAPGTGAGGGENRFWIIGGDSGPTSTFNVSVDYSIDWQISEFSISGGSGTQNYNFTSTHNDAGPGGEYETNGWNNNTTEAFGQSFSATHTVPVNDISQTGGDFEVIFVANASIQVMRQGGNADARAQHSPGMEGRASFEVEYDIWEIQAILPVEYTYVKARENSGFVVLEWGTATETNSEKFIIERMIHDEWKAIGSVDAAGESNSMIAYKYVDKTAIAGENYYRLKQVDLDGSFSYSDMMVVKVTHNDRGPLSLSPNPAYTDIFIKGLSTEKNNYEIRNITGQVLTTGSISNGNRLSIESFEKGIYFFIAYNKKGVSQTVKFVKI